MRTRESNEYTAFTIFCDDIRDEVGGKVSFIGVYQSRSMFIHGTFPVTIPKFGFAVHYAQKKEIFVQPNALRIYLPGDDPEKPSIEAEFPRVEDALKSQARSSETSTPFIVAMARFVVAPLVINQPGTIKVRAVQGDEMIRLGALRVIQAPAEPTSESSTT